MPATDPWPQQETDKAVAKIDLLTKFGVAADIQLLRSSQVNDALDRLKRNDVRYRFVLDMSDLS
jgi:uncharacterized zinc-type alcohol dehydrogenase-like protein